MPLTLILVRHERRNALDRTFDSPLLPSGRAGAEKLAQVLDEALPVVHHCYTSPFRRCLETIAPFVQRRRAQGAPLLARVEHALYERIAAPTPEDEAQGLVPFRRDTYVREVPSESPHRAWIDDAHASHLPPAAVGWDESVDRVRVRARAFLCHLAATHGGCGGGDCDREVCALVVTHLSVVNALLGRADDAKYPMGGAMRVAVNADGCIIDTTPINFVDSEPIDSEPVDPEPVDPEPVDPEPAGI